MATQSLHRLLKLDGASLADGSLLLSLHPDGSRVAAAKGSTLCICPLRPSAPPASPSQVHAAAELDGSLINEHKDAQDAKEQQALRKRQTTHGSAGLSGTASAGPPPARFLCPSTSGPPVVSPDDITALAWVAFARPPSAAAAPVGSSPQGSRGRGGGSSSGGGGAAAATAASQGWPGGRGGGSGRRRTNSSTGSGGVFASIQVMLEDHELQRQQQQAATVVTHPDYSLVVLLSGTRGGALQLHHANSGAVLLRQQLHTGPVVSIAVRTWRMGLNPNEAAEDVTVAWADAVARLAAWELRAAATTCYAAYAAAEGRRTRGVGGAGAGDGGAGGQTLFGLWGSAAAAAPTGPDIKPLVVQKWGLPPGATRGRCSGVVCCGQRPRDLYSLLQGIGSSMPTGKTIFLASGSNRSTCLAALEVDEQSPGGSGGALSYISSVATSMWGLARTARSVATAPLALRDGLKSFVLNPLQLGAAGGGGGDAIDGSGGAAAPLASFPDATAGQRLPSTGLWRVYRDDGRSVLALAPAPHGSLVAAVDSLGRLLLVEMGAMLVSRMWKGYRDAQVAWMEVRARRVARLQGRLRAEGSRTTEQQQPLQSAIQEQQQKVLLPEAAAPSHDESQGHGPRNGGEGDRTGASTQRGTGWSCSKLGHASELRRGDTDTDGDGEVGSSLDHHRSARGFTPASAGQTIGQRMTHGARASDGYGSGEGDGEYVLLLAVYAPRRQTLELWFPLHGERLAAMAAPPKARLLQRGGGGAGKGGELGTWRVADAASAAWPPMTPTGCLMCFVGTAPSLGLTTELLPAAAADGSRGLELLDVGALFGLT